ncbi:MAG: carboxylating nicotinate-nucleotide diphosphorylase [bacterium]
MEHCFTAALLDDWIKAVLAEDVGPGDVTTNALVPSSARARMWWEAKSELTACGMELAARFFTILDPDCRVIRTAEDGTGARPGDILLEVRGSARALLCAERSALNVAQHLCGVATLTREFVERVRGTGAVIAATRKTMPLLRGLEKQAVCAGGGVPHRFGLSDGVLIKENHLAMAGSIIEAVARGREGAHHLLRIEVEVTSIEELEQALEAGADLALLDNMGMEAMRESVRLCRGRIPLEASGNVTLDNVREVAETGVDIISVGALTHSAPSADISARLGSLEDKHD